MKLLTIVARLLCVTSLIYPASLENKRILMNGPNNGMETNSKETGFDGNGFITSVVFKDNNVTISEVAMPKSNSLTFPLSDFLERDYFNLFSKMLYSFFVRKNIQSGTRNTIVLKYKNCYYATEETCRPLKLYFDNNENIQISGKSKTIERMGPHMIEDNTIMSYKGQDKYPIRINNTNSIPWTPNKYPVLVHDGIKTKDDKSYIFPITSTGVGKMDDYLKRRIRIPFDSKLNKAGWLVYDINTNNCTELWMDEYTDIFHISYTEELRDGIHKIYASFVYNFTEWLNDKEVDLGIFLKEVTINMKNMEIIEVHNTGLRMDFVNEYRGYLIGSSLTEKPKAIFYNIETKEKFGLDIPGSEVREMLPYNGMLIYFSHEENLTRTFLYIISMFNAQVINKIEVPNRPPGAHTTMF